MLSRGTLRRVLLARLRQARRPRSQGTDRRNQIPPHMTQIAERPAEVATGTLLCHREGDLIKGVTELARPSAASRSGRHT
jgi:IS30 family transposase